MSLEFRAVYVSHSYRSSDRDLNVYAAELLAEAGLIAYVDPQLESFSDARLEHLLRHSSGFIAVTPYRPPTEGRKDAPTAALAPPGTSSPFILYENGLAIAHGKPRLVLAEGGTQVAAFSAPYTEMFDRRTLTRRRDKLLNSLKEFGDRLSTVADIREAARGVALYLIEEDQVRYKPYRTRILDTLHSAGFEVKTREQLHRLSVRRAVEIATSDVIILDCGTVSSPNADYLQIAGRYPSIKLLATTEDSRERDVEAASKALVGGDFLAFLPKSDHPIAAWSDGEELLENLRRHIHKLTMPYTVLDDRDAMYKYFRSIGRRPLKVFISNTEAGAGLAEAVAEDLSRENINFFHYVRRPEIAPMADWTGEIEHIVETSDVFLAIVTADYLAKEWSSREYRTALTLHQAGALQILPFQAERGANFERFQAVPVHHLPRQEQVSTIRQWIDEVAQKNDEANVDVGMGTTEETSMHHSTGTRAARQDIVVLTFLPEEYAAVSNVLEGDGEPDLGSTVNQYGWRSGTIHNKSRGDYLVTVGITSQAGQGSSQDAASEAIRIFEPSYLVVLGVAGGRRDLGVEVGDVVIATQVHPYEVGKAKDGCMEVRPWKRPSIEPDRSLITAARSLLTDVSSKWRDVEAGGRTRQQRPVHLGPFASGEKVIDDLSVDYVQAVIKAFPDLLGFEMEGDGVATSVNRVAERFGKVGFCMIRGVSDLPSLSTQDYSAGTLQRDSAKDKASIAAAEFFRDLVALRWPRNPLKQSG